MSSLSHQGTPETSHDASIAEKRQQGPSEYELRREANIAENQKLLASLGLSEGGSSVIDKSSSKVKRKKGDKGKRYAFCSFNTYTSMVSNFFRSSPDDGATASTTDQTCPVSPPPMQPLAVATATAGNNNSTALTPPGDGSSNMIFSIFLLVINSCTSLAGPMDISGSSHSSESTTSDNILMDLTLPDTADKALKTILPFLKELSDDKWWTGLLAAWINFEMRGPPKSVSSF